MSFQLDLMSLSFFNFTSARDMFTVLGGQPLGNLISGKNGSFFLCTQGQKKMARFQLVLNGAGFNIMLK